LPAFVRWRFAIRAVAVGESVGLCHFICWTALFAQCFLPSSRSMHRAAPWRFTFMNGHLASAGKPHFDR
jgi:hypothetical protein